jgi:hypothetical protein
MSSIAVEERVIVSLLMHRRVGTVIDRQENLGPFVAYRTFHLRFCSTLPAPDSYPDGQVLTVLESAIVAGLVAHILSAAPIGRN